MVHRVQDPDRIVDRQLGSFTAWNIRGANALATFVTCVV